MAAAFTDCRQEQLQALQRFWSRVYHPQYVLCRSESVFRWQFLGPSGGTVDTFNIKLALIDGEIAATLGYIPVDISLGSNVVRGAFLANWIVDPEERRLGLGPLLMREVTRQFDVTLNNGANEEARSVLTRMAWTDVGALTRYVLVLNEVAAASLTASGVLGSITSRRRSAPSGIAVQAVERFSTRVTHLWDDLAPDIGSGARRSSTYLNWRYADHPVFRYRCFEARRGTEVTGVAIYRVEPVRDRPVRLGRIVEVIGREPEVSALLAAIVSDALAEGAAFLDFFCSSPRLTASMHDSGFVSGENSAAGQLPILFQPLDHRRSAIHFMAHVARQNQTADRSWYVTKGDADQDRPN